jgi:5-carboxymethyl-2-hydroxymuconate isomerase
MPHFSIEYSSNLEKKIDIKNFCNILRLAGIETGVFPIKGIRVRAITCNHYSIADNNPENGFIDISVRLREGRDLETRKKATQHIFDTAQNFLNPILEKTPFALSMEMRNIDPELSPKINSIPNL